MSDVTDLAAAFCPACGQQLARAQAISVQRPIDEAFLGAFTRNGEFHVVVESGEVRLYQHADGGGEA